MPRHRFQGPMPGDELQDDELEDLRVANGYLAIRRLEDGSVAVLHDLAFTRSIALGVTRTAMFTTHRYCFEARAWANREFALLKTKHDVPEGWIAKR